MKKWIMDKHLADIGFTHFFLPLLASAFNLSMYNYNMTHTLVQTIKDLWSTTMGNIVMSTKLRFISLAISIYHYSTSTLLLFLGNSSHRNSRAPGIEWNVASQAILSWASVQQNTLPSLLDMMISMDPSAFLLLGIQIIWSGSTCCIHHSSFMFFGSSPAQILLGTAQWLN